MVLQALAEKEGVADKAAYYGKRAEEELDLSLSIRDHDDNSSSVTYSGL
jgi:hypothetical protein